MANLTLTVDSTIGLDTTGDLHFGSVTNLATQKLTITGWEGAGTGASGTGGQFYFGATSYLSAGELSNITFDGFAGTAVQRADGEIVPAGAYVGGEIGHACFPGVPETSIWLGGGAIVAFTFMHYVRRSRAKRSEERRKPGDG